MLLKSDLLWNPRKALSLETSFGWQSQATDTTGRALIYPKKRKVKGRKSHKMTFVTYD